MLQKLKGILLLFVSVVVFNVFVDSANAGALTVGIAQEISVPQPIIVNVNQDEIKYKKRPFITGLTAKNTEVLVFVDGQYQGQATVNSEGTETDNFYFHVVSELPLGGHRVEVQARDKNTYDVSKNSNEYSFKVSTLPLVPAPTLIATNPTSSSKPVIAGLTIDDSLVHIYIDGEYNGKTDLRSHKSGTANFAYTPFLNLDEGTHKVAAVTEDELGRLSEKSKEIEIKVEAPLPAPVILTTEKSSNVNKTVIAGVVKNDLKVDVYIDDEYAGEANVKNDESGTASFAYQIEEGLDYGEHTVKVVSTDYRGKTSEKTEIAYLDIDKTIQPRISAVAVSDENNIPNISIKDSVAKADLNEEQDNDVIEKSESTELNATAKVSIAKNTIDEDVVVQGFEKDLEEMEKEDEEAKEIAAIISQDYEEEESAGLVNEDKQGLSELQWNFIIFIFFLIAVILWIIWVNRELIKEKNMNESEEADS